MKKIIILFEVLLFSILNTFYKYITVKKYLNNYNYNISVVGSYSISSNSNIPYFKIFIFSFIVSMLSLLIILFILKKGNDISLSNTINKFSNYYLFIFLVLSSFTLCFSFLLFYICILAFYIFFCFFLFNKFENKKVNIFACLVLAINILILYYISL